MAELTAVSVRREKGKALPQNAGEFRFPDLKRPERETGSGGHIANRKGIDASGRSERPKAAPETTDDTGFHSNVHAGHKKHIRPEKTADERPRAERRLRIRGPRSLPTDILKSVRSTRRDARTAGRELDAGIERVTRAPARPGKRGRAGLHERQDERQPQPRPGQRPGGATGKEEQRKGQRRWGVVLRIQGSRHSRRQSRRPAHPHRYERKRKRHEQPGRSDREDDALGNPARGGHSGQGLRLKENSEWLHRRGITPVIHKKKTRVESMSGERENTL